MMGNVAIQSIASKVSTVTVEEGEAYHRIYNCEGGVYKYQITHTSTIIVASAKAEGYQSANIVWKVNGVPLLERVPLNAEMVPVKTTIPSTLGEYKDYRNTIVIYMFPNAGEIVLGISPEAGNCTLEVEVVASESVNSNTWSSPSIDSARISVTGIHIAWDPKLQKDAEKCARDALRKIWNDKVWPPEVPVHPDGPIEHVRLALDLLERVRLTEIADQTEQVAFRESGSAEEGGHDGSIPS